MSRQLIHRRLREQLAVCDSSLRCLVRSFAHFPGYTTSGLFAVWNKNSNTQELSDRLAAWSYWSPPSRRRRPRRRRSCLEAD